MIRRNQTGYVLFIVIGAVAVLLISAALAFIPATLNAQDDDPQATINAAVEIALTQTAEAASIDPAATQAFQQTVEAAISAALTATAVAQQATPVPTLSLENALTTDDVQRLTSAHVLTGHDGWVKSVDVSRDGLIASGGEDGTVRLWDLSSPDDPVILDHENPVLGVAFNPVLPELITTTANGTLTRWDTESAAMIEQVDDYSTTTSEGLLPVGFRADGQQFATFDFNGTFSVWDYPIARPYNSSTTYGFALASLDDNVLAATLAEQPGTIEFIDMTDAEVMRTIDLNVGYAEPVAFNADYSEVIITADDGVNRVLDVETGEQVLRYNHYGYGLAVFSPDNALIAEGGQDGTLYILDGKTGEEITALAGHTAGISEVVFSPDGSFIISGSEDGTVRVWQTGQVVAAPTSAPREGEPADEDNGPTPLPEGFPPITEADVQMAEQLFEGGRMFWVQPVNQIWVMIVEDQGTGQWLVYEDNFIEGQDPETDPNITPPEGRYQPERGFGKLWRENPEIRDTLGWAITPEFGYISRYRYVPGGEMTNGNYVPGPGYHVLFSLDSEAFRFNETNGTWQLGER